MPRPKITAFSGDSKSGSQLREYCDGRTELIPLQGGVNYRGYHKSAAVKSDGFRATDYSCCWINGHEAATGSWKSSGNSCAYVTGYGPPPYYNPIVAWRMKPYYNVYPIPTRYFPLRHMYFDVASTSLSVLPSANFNKLKDSLTNDFLNKIKDQKAMALVSLAESKQTVALARSLGKDALDLLEFIAKGIYQPKSLIDTYRKFSAKYGPRRNAFSVKSMGGRRLSKSDRTFINRMQMYYKDHPQRHASLLRDIPETASKRWLQYRYGIGPTLGDLQAAHDYVYTKWHEFVHTNHIVVKYRKTVDLNVSSATDNSTIGMVSGTSKSYAQYISRFFISNQIAQHTKKIGFSPSELPAAMWELIPFSFVADWIYDVGGYLNAVSATAGLTHVQTSFSIKEEATCDINVSGSYKPFGVIDAPTSTTGKVEYGGFIRKTYLNFPFPVAPTLTFPFDSLYDRRIFDSIALLFGGWNSKQLNNRGA